MWIHLKSIELNLIRREYGHDNLPLTDAQDLLFKTQIADGDVHEGIMINKIANSFLNSLL